MDGPLAVGGPKRGETSRANVSPAALGSIRPERTNVRNSTVSIMIRLNSSVVAVAIASLGLPTALGR